MNGAMRFRQAWLRPCLVIAACVGAAATAAEAGPRLEIGRRIAELGEIVRGEERSVTFALRNVGDAPLQILSASPG